LAVHRVRGRPRTPGALARPAGPFLSLV
jgi:hypothetical protein